MAKNFIEELNKRIDEMLKQKEAESQSIDSQIASAQSEIAKLRETMDDAQETLDAETYVKAKDAARVLQTKIEMLEKRKAQHDKKELISEAESDEVIKSILAHENELAEDFHKDAMELLWQLKERNDKYRAELAASNNTLSRWTNNIHENYRSETTTYADGTNRSPVPVPVRTSPFFGSPLSNKVTDFLKSVLKNKEKEDE